MSATSFLPVDYTGLSPTADIIDAAPEHVAIVMDGNGRWANSRGLSRIEGHKAGEAVLLDVVAGAIQAGVKFLTVYAFSTENWSRSPEEVRFLMGFNRDVLRRQRDQLNHWNVRIRWAGRKPRLWSSVIRELQVAERKTAKNSGLQLTMCVNYGGRVELVDAVRQIAEDAAAGRINPKRISERTLASHLYAPELPDVDLFLRSSGEQRTSNFLPWQSAYAEMVFLSTLWPDFSRQELWRAIEIFGSRNRRFGKAIDAVDADGTKNMSEATREASINVTRDAINEASSEAIADVSKHVSKHVNKRVNKHISNDASTNDTGDISTEETTLPEAEDNG